MIPVVLLIYLNTFFLILKPLRISFKLIFFYWAIIYLIFVSVLHYPEPSAQSDLENYSNYFTSNEGVPFWLIGTEIKHYREFLYHFTSRLLYLIVEDRFLTFLLLDILLCILIFKYLALQDLRNEKLSYLLFGILLFFPIFCGYQGPYRQLFSILLFLLSTGYIKSGSKKIGLCFFVISIFFHNSSALFFPLILLILGKRKSSLIGLIFVYFALKIASSRSNQLFYREEVFYGNTVAISFLIFFIFMFLFLLISNFNKNHNNSVGIVLLTTAIYIIGFFTLDSILLIERIGFFCFAVIYFPCSKLFDCIRPRVVGRLCFLHLSILPIFIFYNYWLIH